MLAPYESPKTASVNPEIIASAEICQSSAIGWNLLDQGRADHQTVTRAIRAAVGREKALIQFETAGGDPAQWPGSSAFFFFHFFLGDPDDEPNPRKKSTSTDAEQVSIDHSAMEQDDPTGPARDAPAESAPQDLPAKPVQVAATQADTDEMDRRLATIAAAMASAMASGGHPPRQQLRVTKDADKARVAAPVEPEGPQGRHRAEMTPTSRKQDSTQDTEFSARILDVTERMSKTHRTTGKANDKTLTQMRVIAELFCEITQLDDVRQVKQQHLARFVATLDRLPPDYRRSEAERKKPIGQIIKEAKTAGRPVGLSVATVNRNLTHIGKIFKAARSEGIQIDQSIDPTLLRRVSKIAAKDERLPYSPADVKAIFAAPVWTGCKSVGRRRDPGALIIKDWRYWVPLIAVYTGARREEICGLEPGDIEVEEGIPTFRIRPNALRGLKNPQSQRRVPIHSHLIELGFLDYVQDQRNREQAQLFDLKRKSPQSQLGDSIDYHWRHLQEDQIGKQERKTFHSFRHYAIHGLRAQSEVEKHIRAELFGHLVGDIEDDRYGGGSPIEQLRAAVEALPRVF